MPVKSLLSSTARTLSGQQRAELAIETIKHNRPITELSAQHNVSRNFLYDQKDKALSAINDKFISPIIEEDEKPLYYIAITKSWIKQFIICLAMHCRGSIRGIQSSKPPALLQRYVAKPLHRRWQLMTLTILSITLALIVD